MPKIEPDTDPALVPQRERGVKNGYDGPLPTVEWLQDCARGTLQEWFDGYMPADDSDPQVHDGNPLGQWYVSRVGEFGDADLYRVVPVTDQGVDRYSSVGPVFRIQVLVERDPEAEAK